MKNLSWNYDIANAQYGTRITFPSIQNIVPNWDEGSKIHKTFKCKF